MRQIVFSENKNYLPAKLLYFGQNKPAPGSISFLLPLHAYKPERYCTAHHT